MENNVSTHTNELTPEASLKIIYEMIESTKSRIGRNYFYYLFWGYLVAATCILEIILIRLEYKSHYLVWPILMVSGALISLVFYLRSRKTVTGRTFIGTSMVYLWLGWAISFIILILFVNLRRDFGLMIPMILAMYGLAIFVAGGMVSFRPLLIGAVISWIAAVVSYFTPYQVQLMIMAGALIFSYIIPGHILKIRNKDQKDV